MAGDPALAALGESAPAQAIERLREEWGLNRPVLSQYSDFLWGLLHGDLGRAYYNNVLIMSLLIHAFPYTIILTCLFIIGGLIVGIPLGIATALHAGSYIDNIGRVISLAGMSLPTFYIGILLLLLFALKLGWFPAMGGGEAGNLRDQLHHVVLPALAGALYLAAYVTRFVRSSLLEVIRQDYINTARSKGLRESKVIYKHAMRNSLISLVTVIGMYFVMLFGGSVLTEIIFSRPGLGKVIVGAINQRDYMVLQGVMLIYMLLTVCINLLVDLSYGLIDPRIRYE